MMDKIQEIVELLGKRDKVILYLVYNCLTPKFREPVVQVYLNHMTVADYACLVGINRGEVKHILHNAMNKLADEYYNYTVMNNIDKNSIYVLDLDKRLTHILVGHGIKTITDLEREARRDTLQDMRYIGDKYISDIKVAYKNKKGYDLVIKGSTESMTDYNENVSMNMQLLDLYMKRYGLSKDDATKLISIVDDVVYARLKSRRS